MSEGVEALALRLETSLRELGSVVVAYSGGVDSAVVLAAALRELPGRALALMALSPSFPPWEEASARAQVLALGGELLAVRTEELTDERYRLNLGDRCYHCKNALFEACEIARAQRGFAHIAYGAHLGDLGENRPGHAAAMLLGVRAPLVDCAMDKPEVRALARHYALPSAEKAAMACLSSRFPRGVAVSEDRLAQVARAEMALHALGFADVRVRHDGTGARVEVAARDLGRLESDEMRENLARAVRAEGFARVLLDLDGYLSGGADSRNARRLRVLA